MRYRLFKKEDGSIVYNCPSMRFQNEDFDKCPIPDVLKGLDYITVDESEFQRQPGDMIEMAYFDGACNKENIKWDRSWNRQLMPYWMVAKKHLERCERLIDEELEKEQPDPVVLAMNTREVSKCKKYMAERDAKSCYELAVKNLDRRVQEGESDKPNIRKKLSEKIAEFKNI